MGKRMVIIGGTVQKGAYQQEILCLAASFPKSASPSVSWSHIEHSQPDLTGKPLFLMHYAWRPRINLGFAVDKEHND